MIPFFDATNPTMPLRSREDHPFRNARRAKDAEHLFVSELQMYRVQA